MLLQCTKIMQDRLSKSNIRFVDAVGHVNDFHSWHVHMITIARRKVFVLMNDATRYPVVIYRASDADLKHPEALFRTAIAKALLEEGFDRAVVEEYTQEEFCFSKCSQMSYVSKLNALCQDIRNHYVSCFEPSMICQPRLSVLLSHQAQTYGRRIHMPWLKMLQQLSIASQQDKLINTVTYQVKVSIDLQNAVVMRRFTIPAHYTFHQLHMTIRVLFQWPAAMKHVFFLDDLSINDGSIAGQEGVLDTQIRLSEYLKKAQSCSYQNVWKHKIELEGVIEAGHRPSPYLIDREGIRPPLNVRTEKSYLEYLKIINNPKSKRYRKLKAENSGERYEKNCSDDRLNILLNKWPQSCRSNHEHK